MGDHSLYLIRAARNRVAPLLLVVKGVIIVARLAFCLTRKSTSLWEENGVKPVLYEKEAVKVAT